MLVRSSGKQSLLAIGIGGPFDRMDAKLDSLVPADPCNHDGSDPHARTAHHFPEGR